MIYNASENIENNLEFIASSKDDYFNDVYQIMPNGSVASYTCPEGWVFEDSFNITQYSYCENGTWREDFNTSKKCTRKYKKDKI